MKKLFLLLFVALIFAPATYAQDAEEVESAESEEFGQIVLCRGNAGKLHPPKYLEPWQSHYIREEVQTRPGQGSREIWDRDPTLFDLTCPNRLVIQPVER